MKTSDHAQGSIIHAGSEDTMLKENYPSILLTNHVAISYSMLHMLFKCKPTFHSYTLWSLVLQSILYF